jgi:flagellar basal-body rod modification protein FlgD
MSDLSSIGAVSNATSATGAAAASRIPKQTLGQDDFLQLLVTQLSAQDPLNPQSDTQFISQMAQFSALENSKSMQTEMQSMRASQLLGQTVEVKVDGDHSVSGVVSAAAVDAQTGEPQIIVNGTPYSVSDVIRVQQSPVQQVATRIPSYPT